MRWMTTAILQGPHSDAPRARIPRLTACAVLLREAIWTEGLRERRGADRRVHRAAAHQLATQGRLPPAPGSTDAAASKGRVQAALAREHRRRLDRGRDELANRQSGLEQRHGRGQGTAGWVWRWGVREWITEVWSAREGPVPKVRDCRVCGRERESDPFPRAVVAEPGSRVGADQRPLCWLSGPCGWSEVRPRSWILATCPFATGMLTWLPQPLSDGTSSSVSSMDCLALSDLFSTPDDVFAAPSAPPRSRRTSRSATASRASLLTF